MNSFKWGKKIILFCLIVSLMGGIGVSCSFNKIKDSVKQKIDSMGDKGTYGVSASHPLAVEEGMKVLKNGGSAVDAAIVVSYVLGVVELHASGIGGGGGMLIISKDKETFIDYRETTPYFTGNQKPHIGVPGFVAGMEYIHDNYGSLPMGELLQPAINYAEKGFKVDDSLTMRLDLAKPRIYSDKLSIFYPNGEPIETGETLIQTDLARTLKKIQKEGAKGFYEGGVARAISKTAKISLEDIKGYKVEVRKPVKGNYMGYDVYTAPPPFSGVTLLQMLKLAEKKEIYKDVDHTATYMSKMEEISRIAYQDRKKNLGDPNYVNMDPNKMVSDKYISTMKNENGDALSEAEHESTTHFVIIDRDGTVVSSTNTLSNFFGTGKYTAGFFLNNQLQNFGSEGFNSYEPGKRSRTFMAPTVLKKDGETIGIGSPGGNRIPQILTPILDKYTHGKGSLQDIINEYRFTFEKNTAYTEIQLSSEVKNELSRKGLNVKKKVSPAFFGGVQALIKDERDNVITGAGDGRRNGTWKSNK
ncbi:capsule biosynthesis gamma-glutamyltransferase CapD [Bacillus anthracis]|uniref:capsule biosynthesis gamma-glutamyltransferase CapD n=1 Tax=Bacillus anthracis TaxID=1392 RepID=UPI001650E72D|nr:capsule biosynthesis gamma-glutamyltransferase CapD [Bacillus anthracis]